MLIFQFKRQNLSVFEETDDNLNPLPQWANEPSNLKHFRGENAVLLLDYETYFYPSRRSRIFEKYPFLQQVASIVSPQEAIGGYVQSIAPNCDSDFQVIDFESEGIFAYTISFIDHQYFCKGRIDNEIRAKIEHLAQSILKLSPMQMVKFQEFMESASSDGKTYRQTIREAITEYGKGAIEFNDILAVLDQPEWAHINLSDLIGFKDKIIEACETEIPKALMMTGGLSYLFTEKEMIQDGMEKIQGTVHLMKIRHQFYPKAQTSIALGVYCYPNWIQLPVYQAQCDYQTYCVPKSIELVDSGSITIYRGEEPLTVKTSHTLGRIKLEIYLDGNQNLLLVAGEETHLFV